jgi:hypothetical protein
MVIRVIVKSTGLSGVNRQIGEFAIVVNDHLSRCDFYAPAFLP